MNNVNTNEIVNNSFYNIKKNKILRNKLKKCKTSKLKISLRQYLPNGFGAFPVKILDVSLQKLAL